MLSEKTLRKEVRILARVKSQKTTIQNTKPMRPALTPEARENQLISLAIDLVEQRLIDGTASSQETTHFLKLASRKAKLEVERAQLENELIKAKTQSINDQADIKKLYADAIEAMKRYSGHRSDAEDYDDY